jgi:hypothetical protein
MFKQFEIVLTTLYLVLSAALLAAMAFRIRGALIRRAAGMSIWDQRVGITTGPASSPWRAIRHRSPSSSTACRR